MRKLNFLTLLLALVLGCGLYSAVPARAAGYKFSYQLKQSGTVSISVFSAGGKLVRRVLVGRREKAGPHQVVWDGTNQQGRPVSAGRYVWKGAGAHLRAKYRMTVGNSGHPPYRNRTGLGSWGGWNPSAVASGGKNWYLLCRMQEGEGLLIKVNAAGQVRWKAAVPGSINGYDATGQMAVACGKRYVYVAGTAANWDAAGMYHPRDGIWRVNRRDGNYVPWKKTGKLVLWVDQARAAGPGQSKLYHQYISDAVIWKRMRHGDWADPYPLVGVRGLAAAGGRIYVPLYFQNRIAVYDESGSLVKTISGVTKPQGVAIHKGLLYVASGHRVLRINASTGAKLAVAARGLDAPWGVAVDQAGNVYVTDLGHSQQIKKFSPAGKLLLTIGRPGGDPLFKHGAVLPNVLHFPLGLAVNNSGQIAMADSGVPDVWYGGGSRQLVFDAAGRPIHQWLNPGATESSVVLAPGSRGHWHLFTGSSGNYEFTVNWRKKTWRWAAFWYPGGDDWTGVFWNPRLLAISRGGGAESVRVHDGQRYLFMPGIDPSIFKINGTRLAPCVATGSWFPASLKKGWQAGSTPGPANQYAKNKPGFTYENASGVFLWEDLNGDGKVQPNEVTFAKTPDGGGFASNNADYMDRHFNLYLVNSFSGKGQGNIYELPCLGFNARGTPLYNWNKAKVVVRHGLLPQQPYTSGKGTYDNYDWYIATGRKGDIYAVQTTIGPDKGIGWAADIHLSKLTKWNSQGHKLWRIGKKATGFARHGESYRLTGISGITQGLVFCSDVAGPERIYTKDGLYVGSVLADLARAPVPGRYTIYCENFRHFVFTDPQTGRTWLLGGYDGVNFYQIRGIRKLQRFGGAVTVTAKAAAAIRPQRTHAGHGGSAARLAMVTVEPVRGAPPPIDGRLKGWNLACPAGPIALDPTDPRLLHRQAAWVYTMWNKKNFYIAARVFDRTPLVNKGRLSGQWYFWDSLQVRMLMPSGPMDLGLFEDSLNHRTYVNKSWGGPQGYTHSAYLPHVPEAFHEWADGKGYNLTVAIPWKGLDSHFSARAGAVFRCGLQMNWNLTDNPATDGIGVEVPWGGAMQFSGPAGYAPAVLLPHRATKVYGVTPVSGSKTGRKVSLLNTRLAGWPSTDVATIEVSPGAKQFSGRVRACYSPKYLYLAYQVNDTSPMENAGGNIAMCFKTGDTCEVFLATHRRDNPHRTEPTAGDYRIVMTYLHNTQPVVAAFRAVVPGMKQRYVTSPGGQAPLDEVQKIPGAKMVLRRWPGNRGYTLVAAIPWKYLGIVPKPGWVMQADFAVNFSDPTGHFNVAKIYWSGHNAMVNDLAQETMIHPNQWDWMSLLP